MTATETPVPAEPAPGEPRWRRWAPRGLIALGALLTVVACLGIWAKRQLLDTDNWVHTSSALLQDSAVQDATAAYLADQISSNVTGEQLAARLPAPLKPLAPQAAAALSELADRVSKRALRSGAFQTLWQNTNRATHEQFVKLVNGDSKQLLGRSVVLDLRPMVGRLGERIGLGPDFAQTLEEGQGRLRVVQEEDVEGLRQAVDILKAVAWWAAFLAIACLAGAVAIARDRRRTVLMSCGFAFAGAGLLLLVVRRIAGNEVVDAVTGNGAAQPAAEATWRIATSLLQDISQATVVLGLVVVLAGWFAGPAKWAVNARTFVAPVLREHSGAVWGTATLLMLVLLAWAPLPAMRTVFGAVFFTALLAGGLFTLQRQVEREFPA